MQLGKGRRRVSVVELPAQHLKKVKSRRTGISSVNRSRDLAENVINDGVLGGGGRFVIVDGTAESSVEGAFPPGDPNRGL